MGRNILKENHNPGTVKAHYEGGSELTNPESNSQFSDRLKAAIPAGMTQQEFAARIGVSVSGLRKWLAGSAEPGIGHLPRIAAETGKSIEWLVSGASSGDNAALGAPSYAVEPVPVRKTPLYDAVFSAGAGAADTTETVSEYIDIPISYIREELKANPAHLVGVRVHGDSMEPTLRDQDVALIDLSKTEVDRDAVYAFLADGEGFLKRLVRAGIDEWLVRSDNPAYTEWRLNHRTLTRGRIVGLVVGRIGRM